MTYQNIKNLSNNNYKNALGNGVQIFSSDGLCGGINGSISLYPRTSCTETIDLSTINAAYIGLADSCFDGRYIYIITQFESDLSPNKYLLRYDTTAAFATGNVAAVKLDDINANYYGYVSLTFDGRYIYLTPYANDSDYHGYFLRYDTTAAFATGNFTVFDLSSISSHYVGYRSSCFDGRYVYLAPYTEGTKHGHFLRYDTTLAFNSASSYEIINLASINAAYVGYISSTFDGRYVYLVPFINNSVIHGNLIRYDTTQDFVTGSIEVLNLASINASYTGFYNAGFDGRYVYLIPDRTEPATTYHGKLVRYDTTKPFNADGIEAYDLTNVDASLKGLKAFCFDGKYVYISSGYNGSIYNDYLVRYDTMKPFGTSGSYDIIHMNNLGTTSDTATSFCFDGQYLYCSFFYTDPATVSGDFTRIKITSYNKFYRGT